MAPHSSNFAWKMPWMEEPGRLQSMGSLGVGYDWATSLSVFTFMHWRRKWQPTPCSCLENPRDGGAWWAAVYGVAQSRTRLKRLSSSSSHKIHANLWLSPNLLYPWTGTQYLFIHFFFSSIYQSTSNGWRSCRDLWLPALLWQSYLFNKIWVPVP